MTTPSPTLAAFRLLAVTLSLGTVPLPSLSQSTDSNTCSSTIVNTGCDPNNQTYCELHCSFPSYPKSTYLNDKCCKHAGITASLLAFEESEQWVPRIEEYQKCTGASIRLQYVEGGEDAMGQALLDDVGESENINTGQGIYDAYIVQAPWLPPVYGGLKSLSEYIKQNDDYIQFMDINQASRSAVSFDGEVRALPLDADYIALGWRQDVFNQHKDAFFQKYNQELIVPRTIEELVDISEKLNGFDHNGDGEPDWGFCLTPQTNYFNAFVGPVLQTHLRECEERGGGLDCSRGGNTGQNIFFDVDTFEPLIYNPGFKYAVELYTRFVQASNCQTQTPAGEKCDRKTAFPTGRCAGVISMPGTLTNLLSEDGSYSVPPEFRYQDALEEGQYHGRRARFPGSTKVVDWKVQGMPLVDCEGAKCPLNEDGINYAPFFSEGGESYALNGRQSKPSATDAMWDMFTWLAELPVGVIPLSGVYRKSQLTEEATAEVAASWNNTVMAQDLHDVLVHYFKNEDEGGNPVQDLFIIGFDDYNDALDTELHQKLVLADVNEGGLLNYENPKESINDVSNADEFNKRYDRFVDALAERYDEVNAKADGGALHQLYLWRGALDLRPTKSEAEICEELLATDVASFDKLNCISAVTLSDLCQSQKSDVEEYAPGTCATNNDNSVIIIAVLCSIVGAGILGFLAYYFYKRYQSYRRIRMAHEQLMEATLNEAIRALHQLDYPLHLVRGDEFVDEGKLMRHEVLRNTHKLTVLDSLSDVDAFIAAGQHVVFFSHQWTSFTAPDPSNTQFETMCVALKELVKREGWSENLKDVFVWVDYSCIPQANSSTQNLAIRSLAAYASSATYFIIAAPDTPHADLEDTCDLQTYQRRMWCRAEQVCHSMRNGTKGMYLAVRNDNALIPVISDFFVESLHVFDGELTCCRLEHKGSGACDRQSLVVPILGLYGELYRAAKEGIKGGNAEALASVEAFLKEIEQHQETVFPRTFTRTTWRKNKRITEEVILFGDLIDRMRHRIDHGVGFSIDTENNGTLSTKGSDFVRHGATDFIRHGVVHGSAHAGGAVVETAVGNISDHMDK